MLSNPLCLLRREQTSTMTYVTPQTCSIVTNLHTQQKILDDEISTSIRSYILYVNTITAYKSAWTTYFTHYLHSACTTYSTHYLHSKCIAYTSHLLSALPPCCINTLH